MGKTKVSSAAEEAKWFDKFNQPTSGVYQLAHAGRQLGDKKPPKFNPNKVRAMVEKNAEAHMQDHIDAMKLGGKSSKRRKSTP